MSEDKENVEDFVSLWRKKMEKETKEKPSAIGETLDRLKELEKENEELRSKIGENIDLLSRTEKIIKKTIDENKQLKEQIKQAGILEGNKMSAIQKENLELNKRISDLLQNLTEKDNTINTKDVEIEALKENIKELSVKLGSVTNTTPDSESEVTKALIEDLKTELAKKKVHVTELETKISNLFKEIEDLNEQLIEKEKTQPIDYVIPIEAPKPTKIKPKPAQPSSRTLEILCQDLQSDLNKYKRIVENLNKEKLNLQQAIEKGGIELDSGEIENLKRENEELRAELSKVQESLRLKSEEDEPSVSITEFENKIKYLEELLKDKDELINELRTSVSPQITAPNGSVDGLIEDLQSKINKLKITIKEKNKIIDELKSS